MCICLCCDFILSKYCILLCVREIHFLKSGFVPINKDDQIHLIFLQLWKFCCTVLFHSRHLQFNFSYFLCLIFCFCPGIQSSGDECQYWEDVAVSGNRLEIQERARSFVELLQPLKQSLSSLPSASLSELSFLLCHPYDMPSLRVYVIQSYTLYALQFDVVCTAKSCQA